MEQVEQAIEPEMNFGVLGHQNLSEDEIQQGTTSFYVNPIDGVYAKYLYP